MTVVPESEKAIDPKTPSKKPLWIPIVGYLVLISGLSSLSDIIVSLIFGDIHVDIGVLFIWLGAGMVQYHRRSLRIFAAMSVIFSVIIIMISVAIVTSLNDSYFMFMGMSFEPMSFVFIVGYSFLMLLAIFLLAVPFFVRRCESYLIENALFHFREIPRSAIPSLVCIVLLSAMLGIADFTVRSLNQDAEDREQQMSQLDYFKIDIKLKDEVTGDRIYYAGYSIDVVPLADGMAYSDGLQMSGEAGTTFRCFGVPPFKVMIFVSSEGYQSKRHQVLISDTNYHRDVELGLRPQD